MLGLLSLQVKRIAVDMIPGCAHRKPPLIELNPFGRLPLLVEGEASVCGAVACLVWLARRHGGADWAAPAAPAEFAAYLSWLEFAAAELPAARAARNASLFGLPGDIEALRARGRRALLRMEDHMTLRALDGADWFVGARASLAEVALFPAFALPRATGAWDTRRFRRCGGGCGAFAPSRASSSCRG
jgi:glutathione S-transferase